MPKTYTVEDTTIALPSFTLKPPVGNAVVSQETWHPSLKQGDVLRKINVSYVENYPDVFKEAAIKAYEAEHERSLKGRKLRCTDWIIPSPYGTQLNDGPLLLEVSKITFVDDKEARNEERLKVAKHNTKMIAGVATTIATIVPIVGMSHIINALDKLDRKARKRYERKQAETAVSRL